MGKKNSSGSAGLIAVLLIIIIIASFIGLMIVYDKNNVENRKNLPAALESSSVDSSSLTDSKEAESEKDVSSNEDTLTETVVYPSEAEQYEDFENDDFTAEYAILVDVDNNEIVAGKSYDKKIYPASLTKLMTLLVAVENIESLDDTYTFTYDDIHPLVVENASRADFAVDETVTAKDMLYASILVSGADGTLGLSKITAGSEEAFVELMNKKAEEMGLKNTHFTNVSGLHDENHYSTAEDIAVILQEAIENETCREILSTVEYTTSKTEQHEEGIILRSLVFQRLTDYYVENGGEILGGKTGFTDESKHSLATFYEDNGKTYVCVTSKSADMWKAVEDSIMLYEKFAVGGSNSGTVREPV